MSFIKILGIGSPFGDDQLGWKAVNLLKQKHALRKYIPHSLVIEKYDRPGFHLLDLMYGAETVFLIDAVKKNAAIGTVHRLKNQEIEGVNNVLSSHSIGIAESLHLARVLDSLPKDIIFYGIEISDIILSFKISNKINHAIIKMVNQMTKELLAMLDVKLTEKKSTSTFY